MIGQIDACAHARCSVVRRQTVGMQGKPGKVVLLLQGQLVIYII